MICSTVLRSALRVVISLVLQTIEDNTENDLAGVADQTFCSIILAPLEVNLLSPVTGPLFWPLLLFPNPLAGIELLGP